MKPLFESRARSGRFVPAPAVLGVLLSLIGASVSSAAPAADPLAAVVCDPDNGGLKLPPGFCAVVVAREVGRARHMVVRPNGDLYVALDNATDGTVTGGVLALRDTNGDGRADLQQRFGPTGGNGIAWDNNQLYFSPNDRVVRWTFAGDELVPNGAPETVVSGLPSTGDHPRKTVLLDRAGRMFVNIGSRSNSCQADNRAPFSPGVDPCAELEVRAGVWTFDTTRTNQAQADGTRFATELRNMNALAINPVDRKLYGVQNSRDQLLENWFTLFDARDDARLPAEELFRIDQGKAYGWPYCFFDGMRNRKVLAPEYGGDGSLVGRCATRQLPVDDYPAHWAPLSMLFYTGGQFPKQYQNGLFVAFHGSRFDTALQPAGPGYVVTFTPWKQARPIGRYKVFADGFAGGTPTPTGAAHRAVGLAQAPDGSIYVSDDKAGWIWRIFYVGNRP